MQHNDQNQLDESDKHQIRINDLPGEVQNIARVIGLKPVLNLVKQYGGDSIYIPKYEAIIRTVRNRAIIAEFNGSNLNDLARKYNLTKRYLREIMKTIR